MKSRFVSIVTISLCLIQAVSAHGQTEPGQNQLQPSGDRVVGNNLKASGWNQSNLLVGFNP